MLDNGDGIPVNYQDAFQLFNFAASNGHPAAMNRLALMYIHGRGVNLDINKGLELLEKAAKLGSENSRLYLGVLYLEGELVPQNLALAKAHFTKIKEHPKAAEFLKNWQQYLDKQPKQPTKSE
jgi:TPR repeat protein